MRCRREPVPGTNGVESFETIELGEEMLQTSREKPLEVVRPPRVSETLRLGRRIDGQLWATRGTREEPVTIVHCFPWTSQISRRWSDLAEALLRPKIPVRYWKLSPP